MTRPSLGGDQKPYLGQSVTFVEATAGEAGFMLK